MNQEILTSYAQVIINYAKDSVGVNKCTIHIDKIQGFTALVFTTNSVQPGIKFIENSAKILAIPQNLADEKKRSDLPDDYRAAVVSKFSATIWRKNIDSAFCDKTAKEDAQFIVVNISELQD